MTSSHNSNSQGWDDERKKRTIAGFLEGAAYYFYQEIGSEYQPVEATGGGSVPLSAQPQVDISKWTPKAIALYILCIYRLLRITNQEYITLLTAKMEQQLTAEGGGGMRLSGATSVYAGWISDRNYLKMVAAYDMFLYNFSGNENGILRLGSLGSRFRDCAGLLSYGYAMGILDVDAGTLMDWIFVKTMGNEILRMTKEGQESGSPSSYFPYQSDLHLVNRSAYSSNANPYIFHWIHIFGTLMSHKRSINARFNFEGNGTDYGKDIEQTLTGQSDEHEQMALELTPEDELWLETTGRDPSTWFALLKANGSKVPPAVAKIIKRQRGRIGETRADSPLKDYKNPMHDDKLSENWLLIQPKILYLAKKKSDSYLKEISRGNMPIKKCHKAEEATVCVASSPLWHELRYCRITTSKFHQAAHFKTPDGALIELIFGASVLDILAMKRGKLLESAVRAEVAKTRKVVIENGGLFLNPIGLI
ncbi:hypothetical protein ACJJTC_014951 [Scirpophaga incertulas]